MTIALKTHSKRGGAGAGDPNHPSLKADPNATYNPYPPKSTYLSGVQGFENSGSNRSIIAIITPVSIFGFLLIVISGWAFLRYRRKKTKVNLKRSLYSIRTKSAFSRQSRGRDWNEMPDDSDDVDHDGIHDQDELERHEAFEMSHEFNYSSITLPFEAGTFDHPNLTDDDDELSPNFFPEKYPSSLTA